MKLQYLHLLEVYKGTTGRRTGQASGGNPGSMDTKGTVKRPKGGPGTPYRDHDSDTVGPTKRRGIHTPGLKTITQKQPTTIKL